MSTQDATGREPPVDADADTGSASATALPAGSPLDSAKAALGIASKQITLPLPNWLGPLAVCCAVGIVPWIVYLGLTLPARRRAVDYDIAWVGFDAAMCVVLAALAYCALRRKTATGPIAAVAATMLVVDAWFDVLTTDTRERLMFAIGSAVFAEIPLAILCIWVVVNAERVRTRSYLTLQERWEQAVGIALARDAEAGPVVTDPPGPLLPR